MDNSVFYYIDGDPLNGKWIDLEYINSIDEVLEELADSGIINRDQDENIDYGGDLLVADTEGDLSRQFYRGHGSFDLDGFIEVRDSGIDEEIACAFLSVCDYWSTSRCRDSYYGFFESINDFAEQYIENSGLLSGISDLMKSYFDFERYGEELLAQEFFEVNGYYFNNW